MISLRPLPSKSVKTVSIAVAALIGVVLVCLAFVVDNPYPYENICSAAGYDHWSGSDLLDKNV